MLLQRACSHSLHLGKYYLFVSFYMPCQRNERALSQRGLKLTNSVCTILKSQNIISLAKVSLTKQFNFIDLQCCKESYALHLQNRKMSKNYFPRKNLIDKRIRFNRAFEQCMYHYVCIINVSLFFNTIYKKNINTAKFFSRTRINEIWW